MKKEKSSFTGRPRDENLAARRQDQILSAASEFFAEFGYRNADIQLLAERLGVGKGTIYRYFPTKETLFFGAVDAGMRQLIEWVDSAVEGEKDPIEHIKLAVHAYLAFFDRNPHIVELLTTERAEFRDREKATYFQYKEREHEKRIKFIMDAMCLGVIRQMDPERIMRIFNDTLYGTIFTNTFSQRKMPFEQQAEDILDILLRGILSDVSQTKP